MGSIVLQRRNLYSRVKWSVLEPGRLSGIAGKPARDPQDNASVRLRPRSRRPSPCVGNPDSDVGAVSESQAAPHRRSVSQEPRLQAEDGCASTSAWRPLPRICDASHNWADHREGCMGADARERAQINELTAAQESSVVVKGRIAEESELTPGLMSEDAQVTTPIVASAPAALCPAEHTLPSTPPRKHRRRTTNRKALTPPALTTAGQAESVDPRGAQQYISSREPHAMDSGRSNKAEHQPAVPKGTAALAMLAPTDSGAQVRVSEPLTLGGVLTSDPIDRALPGRPPRRRRGGRRG